MLDLLLGSNPLFASFFQQKDPLAALTNTAQNPASMFTGLGAEAEGNPFAQQAGEFNGGQANNIEKIGVLARKSDQPEQSAKPEPEPEKKVNQGDLENFPLPENGKPTGKEPIEAKYKNADGTTKSARTILNDSSICKNLGSQKDIQELKKKAKKEFGDWEKEKDPEKAARSAIKFRQLLEYADNSKSKNGSDRGGEAGNGSLSGITSQGDIRDGTEASTAINFFRHGRDFVLETTQGGRLKNTNDRYVREDGTSRSDAGQFFVDMGKGISHVIPGLGNMISGFADGVDRGAAKGDVGGAILGGLKGGFNGALYTVSNGLNATDITNPEGMIDGVKNLFNGSFTNSL